MMLLEAIGTDRQKERWLKPIVSGEARSAFAMTEPHPGGGSDPSMIKPAPRSAGALRRHGPQMVHHRGRGGEPLHPDGGTSEDPRDGLSALLFHKDQPGWRIVRRIPIMGPEEHGGYCELEFDGLEIPEEDLLSGGAGPQVDSDPARPRAADALHALARPRQALHRDRAGLRGRAIRIWAAPRGSRERPADAGRACDEDRNRPDARHEGGLGARSRRVCPQGGLHGEGAGRQRPSTRRPTRRSRSTEPGLFQGYGASSGSTAMRARRAWSTAPTKCTAWS